MLVRLTTGRATAGRTYQPDDVIEVPDSEGKRLIELGAAEAVCIGEADPGASQEQQSTRPETAATQPPRTAMRHSGRIRKATR